MNSKYLEEKIKKFLFLFIILVSFFITKVWVSHTDHLKILLGGYAEQLTSSNLKSWNYGTLSQRLNLGLWKSILERSFLT